jgi:hypothetical protein
VFLLCDAIKLITDVSVTLRNVPLGSREFVQLALNEEVLGHVDAPC